MSGKNIGSNSAGPGIGSVISNVGSRVVNNATAMNNAGNILINEMLSRTHQGSNNEELARIYNMRSMYNTNSANRAMAFNAQQAQINRDYQTYMSNTAHQREMEDLKKAGLNPILTALAGGNGASTPTGSSAQGVAMSSPDYGFDTGENIGSMISAYMNSMPMLLLAGLLSDNKKAVLSVTNTAGSIVNKGVDIFKNTFVKGLLKQVGNIFGKKDKN